MEMGIYFAGEKKWNEAINEFKSILAVNPNDATTWYTLGTLYLNMGNLGEAKKTLLKAKQLGPNFPDTSFNLGLTYFKLGQKLEAQSEWENTIKLDPKHPRAIYNLAGLYSNDGKTEDASNMYCRFVSIAGDKFPSEKTNAEEHIKTQNAKCPH